MLSYLAKILTATLLTSLLIMCLNKVVCKSEKSLDEKVLFTQYENELLETFKKLVEKDVDTRIIACEDIVKKSYHNFTPVTIIATEGMVADLTTIYKCKKRPTVINKVSDGVYSIESFYNFTSFMYGYSAVNLSIHGVYNKSQAIFVLDTVLRANFTMGLLSTERFVNVTEVELLNCTVTKQMIKSVSDMFKYMIPHVAGMFYEHFLRREKLKAENVIKNTFAAITKNSTFLLGSG